MNVGYGYTTPQQTGKDRKLLILLMILLHIAMPSINKISSL